MTQTQTLTEQEMIGDIIEKYHAGIEKQNDMQYFIARRVTYLIRGMMLFTTFILVALFAVIIIFTTHIQDLNNTINTMTEHFSSMTNDVTSMNKSVTSMQYSISHLPNMLSNIQVMQNNVGDMSQDITVHSHYDQ